MDDPTRGTADPTSPPAIDDEYQPEMLEGFVVDESASLGARVAESESARIDIRPQARRRHISGRRRRVAAPAEPAAPSLLADDGLVAMDALIDRIAGDATASPQTCASPLPELLREQFATGGKRIRARLAFAAAEALGSNRSAATAWAAACEILHNASLVHDDIQDGDTVRRGQPTLWVRHGIPTALSAGDWMLMLPYLCVEQVPVGDAVKYALTQTIAHAASLTVHGQAAEPSLGIDGSTAAEQDYYACVEGKTSALFELPVEGAAMIAGHDRETACEIAGEFRLFGVLFQIQDDVLDLYGDKGREAIGNDIREGKVTSLIIEHLRAVPADRAWLRGILQADRDATRDADVAAVIQRLRESGALDRVLSRIQSIAAAVCQSEVLAEHPRLHAVAKQLIELGLRPIQHLLPCADR